MNAGQDLSANQELTQRWQGALMNNYGTPRLPSPRARGSSGVP
jgi:acetylornithine aminotransferase